MGAIKTSVLSRKNVINIIRIGLNWIIGSLASKSLKLTKSFLAAFFPSRVSKRGPSVEKKSFSSNAEFLRRRKDKQKGKEKMIERDN